MIGASADQGRSLFAPLAGSKHEFSEERSEHHTEKCVGLCYVCLIRWDLATTDCFAEKQRGECRLTAGRYMMPPPMQHLCDTYRVVAP